MNSDTILTAENISLTYFGVVDIEVLLDISLWVNDGEFICILGPSGCGKSSFLRILAGIELPSNGTVYLGNRPVTCASEDVGLIFQQSTLFPWLSVRRNIEFALKGRGRSSSVEVGLASGLLKLVGLDESFAELWPSALSGGMLQRVALARALAVKPRILLLDEPFGALDAISRMQMHEVLLDVWEKHCMSVIFVTHDLDEAVTLADRIIVLGPRPAKISGEFRLGLPRPRVESGIQCAGFEIERNRIALESGGLFGSGFLPT
jgi:ABC-type nitrate/sulfonate/bicarbonate transport system ATPase subunit